MPGIGNFLGAPQKSVVSSTSLILNVVHHCIVLYHLATDLQECGRSNLERIRVSTWGVIRGVETQKLKERRRGKTVSNGFKSSMVTISFLPKLACLLSGKDCLITQCDVTHSHSEYGAHLIPEHSR